MAWHGLEMWTPQNAKDTYWQKLKTLHFYFSDPRSLGSIGKPILLKGDEVLLNGILAQNT